MAEKPGKSHLEFSRCSIQDIQTNFKDPDARNCLRKQQHEGKDLFDLAHNLSHLTLYPDVLKRKQ